MKWLGVVILLGLIILGAVVYVMWDMDRRISETVVKEGQILDWYPEKEGLVLTVSTDGKLYRFSTNATEINVKQPLKIVFEKGIPVAIIQNYNNYSILDWQELKTREDMPTVKK